jgi:hypothetical protein
VLLVYLDESYKRGRDYWLAACAIPDEEVGKLCAGVRTAAARIPASFGVPPDVELHAQHLYHGDGAFSPLKGAPRVRIQAYRRGLHALAASAPGIFFVGVDWNSDLPTRHRVATHRLAALRHLLPQLERYCESRCERCLVIADEEATATEHVVAVVREHQMGCESEAANSRVLDTPLFTPSDYSRGVQACDLAAFVRARRAFARPDEDRRAAALTTWWDALRPHIVEDRCHPAPSEVDARFAEGARRGPRSTKGRTRRPDD